MLFARVILIKGRLTNQFFPGRFFKTPSPLTKKRQWPKIPENRFFSTKIGHIGKLSCDMV